MKSFKYLKSSVVLFLFFSLVNISSAATLSFFTPSRTYTVDSDIVLDILVSGAGKSVNTVSGLVSFPTDLLSVSSISKNNSIVDSWIQEPSFSNTTGNINFESVLLPPGLIRNSDKLLTIKFKAKSAGIANINFISGSILTADGVSTDILSNSNSAIFRIYEVGQNEPVMLAPTKENNGSEATETVSITQPDSNRRYSLNSADFPLITGFYKIPPILIILILLLIFLLCYICYKFFNIKNKLKKEVCEAEDTLHKAFSVLKGSEQEQIEILEKTKPKCKLTGEKEKIKRQFKKDLKDAEKYVKKEIEDIEEVIDK